MTVAMLALVALAAAALLAAPPIRSAYRANSLHVTDIALVATPVPAFLLALGVFNEPAHTGWAAIVYPLLLLGFAVAALYVRVFALPPLGFTTKGASAGTMVLVVLVSVLLGALVAPWYD